ncbi:MAG: hypothetical protein ACTSYD_07565 [Candidatus Heimdallarchaeaceae archaeon]
MTIWVVNFNGLSGTLLGYLIAIEMTTTLIIYIPVAYLADYVRHKIKNNIFM